MRRTRPTRLIGRVLCGTAATTIAAFPVLAGTAGAATPSPTVPAINPTPFAAAAPGQSLPDDITVLGTDFFVTYQNGVGPEGQPSKTGATQSSVVEYGPTGTR